MYVDIHSHILPGLDDGATDEETALKMLDMAWNSGTGHIVATPHYINGNTQYGMDIISSKCNALRKLAAGNNLNLAIHEGSEVFLSPDLPALYENGQIYTINRSSYMLIEFPMASIPDYTDNVLFQLQLKGIIPVIAHPERNRVIVKKTWLLKNLVLRGILTQVNSGSITGLYGREIQKVSMKLIKMDLVHFIGSDAHTCNGRSPILAEAAKIVENKFGRGVKERLFTLNGLSLLKDERIQHDRKELYNKVKPKTTRISESGNRVD